MIIELTDLYAYIPFKPELHVQQGVEFKILNWPQLKTKHFEV